MARYPKKVNPYHNSDEIIGQKFGHWTVLERISFGCFLMQCDCGKEMPKRSIDVCRGRSSQCNRCRRRELKEGKSTRISDGSVSGSRVSEWRSIWSIKKEDLDNGRD